MPSIQLSGGGAQPTVIPTDDSAQQQQQQQRSSMPPLPAPIPRDARLIALILASMGIQDAEPQVLHMLLEFAQRYLNDVMSDALVYADHASSAKAGPTGLSMDDVQLAIQSRLNHSFTQPPSKDMLLSLAESINSVPLPPITERYGLRLPPPEHTLTNVNFNIVPHPPPDSDDGEDDDGNEEVERQGAREGEGEQRGRKEGTVGEEDAEEEEEEGDEADATREATINQDEGQRGTKRSLEEDEDYD